MAAWPGAALERRRQWAGFKPVSIGQDSGQMFEIGAVHVPYVPLGKLLFQGKGAHWGPFEQATQCTLWSLTS